MARKPQTFMKLVRERELREKRERKQAKKDAKAEARREPGTDETPAGETVEP